MRLRGYETGLYRVVFFGRPQHMAAVRRNHSVLMSYLPLKISLFEDEGRVVASILQPATLSYFFDDEEIRQLLNTWQEDMTKIMMYYGGCGGAAGSL